MSRGNAAANYQGEEIGPENPQDAADRRPDQPLQAHQPQPPLEDHDREAQRSPDAGVLPGIQAERLKQKASNRNENNK